MRHVRTYPRGTGKAAFEVYHDHTAHEGRGTHRVVLAGKRIGAQISYPTLEDCERMLGTNVARTAISLTGEAQRRLEQARIGQARGARTISLNGRRKSRVA